MVEINKILTSEASEKKVEKYCSPDFEVMDVLFDPFRQRRQQRFARF